jgi:hypothetical protein
MLRGREVPSRSQTEENVVPNGRRAVRSEVVRRLAKLTALRELVSPDLAILAVDLVPGKQAAIVRITTRCCRGGVCINQILAEPVAARAGSPGWYWRASRPGIREGLAVTAGEANL